MGLGTVNGSNDSTPEATNELYGTRFGAYFPRVFACAYSLTEDEAAAKEVTIEAFTRVFAHPAGLGDEEFVILLFDTARDLCRGARRASGLDSGLSGRERELLALVFDARLSRDEIRRLMRTSEQALSAVLLTALRKLRSGMTPSPAKTSLRPA